MYKRWDKEFVIDMFLACKRIMEYTHSLSFEDFTKDTKTIDAVVRNIEILGEAVKKNSKNFREKYPEIEWNIIAKTRDKLIYFGVDTMTIWKTIKFNIPTLLNNLNNVIKKENWETEIEL